jgi:DNA-binding transcriptional ArsR family regulator
MVGKVVLDVTSLKALAAKPRLDMLSYLSKRRHTATEMAKHLHVSVPTAKEHLQSLERAGLIVKHDEGHKWKYYSLSTKGKSVLEPKERSFAIVWVATLLGAVGLGYSLIQLFPRTTAIAMSAPAMERADMAMTAPAEMVSSATITFPVIASVLFILMIVSLLYYLYRR